MPGQTFEDKFANLRAAYGFMMGHPGKKLLFMGQDFAQMDEWNENAAIVRGMVRYPIDSQMKEYVKELNHLYTSHPALYQKDYQTEGFEWIYFTLNYQDIFPKFFLKDISSSNIYNNYTGKVGYLILHQKQKISFQYFHLFTYE